jgi:hypothetical protein
MGARRRAYVWATVPLLLALLGAGCGDSGGSSSDAGAAKPTTAPSSKSDSLVGAWQRTTTCAEYVGALTRAGFKEAALGAAAGNGFIEGVSTVKDLADPAHPCKGAIARRHSHFFTSGGMFGSRDWRGEQVDDGTYETHGNHTLVMPYRFEHGSPIEMKFHYRIAGDTIKFEPRIPSDCSSKRCREAAGWAVSVALPGKAWRRAD